MLALLFAHWRKDAKVIERCLFVLLRAANERRGGSTPCEGFRRTKLKGCANEWMDGPIHTCMYAVGIATPTELLLEEDHATAPCLLHVVFPTTATKQHVLITETVLGSSRTEHAAVAHLHGMTRHCLRRNSVVVDGQIVRLTGTIRVAFLKQGILTLPRGLRRLKHFFFSPVTGHAWKGN